METIKKINKYLVEHYPLIWNTRLVWMLTFAVVLHLAFFIAGYFSVNTQKDVSSHYSLEGFYFDSPAILIGVLISIISLLIWIIFYLKNNAFKNFYPLKKGTLFIQFCILFLIFFTNITHYYSYKKGITTKIKVLYDWENIDADIKKFNNAAIFFLKNRSNYTIKAKQYPEPFPLQVVSTERTDYLGVTIDTTRAYLRHDGEFHQFFKIDEELIAKDSKNNVFTEDGIYDEESYVRNNQPFKYRIVYDISSYKELITPNLYNFSQEFISYGQDSIDYRNRLIHYQKLLDKKDESVISNELDQFYNLAKQYEVEHNLKKEDWLYLINLENDYKYIINIQDRKPQKYEINKLKLNYFKTKKRVDTILIPNTQHKKDYLYYSRFPKTADGKSVLIEKDYDEYFDYIPYCDFGRLNIFFRNVYYTFHPTFDIASLYAFIILSLIFSLLIFLFKTTDIRNILLSVVAAGIVLIFGILLIYIADKYLGFNNRIGIFIALLLNILIVVFSILGLIGKWRKTLVSILFSLALFAIPLVVLFSYLYYRELLGYPDRTKDLFILWFDDYGFWFTIIIWIISIYFYSKSIRKWKALTE
ncbi:VIT1/CCC1 transporter family protein [Tenacibaculum jejuense]|uniref:Probable ABC-type transport system, permease component n=1 Tax=Tenacibaculum jejuense TaxID=584609 RepID=A0A238U9H0_9FLAO|nr:hypothetical protein [Tenacibaculum jejuense]SNR15853.1 Probable ABC-type transport system, permease component [Tenacibaculum jejuense]